MRKCYRCGQQHDWNTTQVVFTSPDEYDQLSVSDKSVRAKLSSDICIIDNTNYFIRGLLPIRIKNEKREYTFGVWIKIDTETYGTIYDNWNTPNQEHLTGLKGHLANEIDYYTNTLGKEVNIKLISDKTRPKFYFSTDDRLKNIQMTEIDNNELMDIYHFHFGDELS